MEASKGGQEPAQDPKTPDLAGLSFEELLELSAGVPAGKIGELLPDDVKKAVLGQLAERWAIERARGILNPPESE